MLAAVVTQLLLLLLVLLKILPCVSVTTISNDEDNAEAKDIASS